MAENRQYDHEYKVQAVKLAKEIGQAKAAKELGIPKKHHVWLGTGQPPWQPRPWDRFTNSAKRHDA